MPIREKNSTQCYLRVRLSTCSCDFDTAFPLLQLYYTYGILSDVTTDILMNRETMKEWKVEEDMTSSLISRMVCAMCMVGNLVEEVWKVFWKGEKNEKL